MAWLTNFVRYLSITTLLTSQVLGSSVIPRAGEYQNRYLSTGTAFAAEENGVWTLADVLGNGNLDLVYIKTRNTGSGKTEVHVASAASNFQTRTLSVASDFNQEENGTWLVADFDGDGKADLIFIKTRNTPQGKVEIHVASAASNFKTRIYESATVFNIEENGTWTLAKSTNPTSTRRLDLVYIKTRNTGTGRTEVHIASAASNYQSFITQTGTTFVQEENGTWLFTPFANSATNDLVYLKTRNSGTGTTEIHVAPGPSFQTRYFEAGTTYTQEENGFWLVARVTKKTWPDLVYIKTRNTGTGKIEVHISAAP